MKTLETKFAAPGQTSGQWVLKVARLGPDRKPDKWFCGAGDFAENLKQLPHRGAADKRTVHEVDVKGFAHTKWDDKSPRDIPRVTCAPCRGERLHRRE